MSDIILEYNHLNNLVNGEFETILKNKIQLFTSQMPDIKFNKFGRACLGSVTGKYNDYEIKNLTDAILTDLALINIEDKESNILNALRKLDITHIYCDDRESYYSIDKLTNKLLENELMSFVSIRRAITKLLKYTLVQNNGLLKVIKSGHKVNYKFSKLLARYFDLEAQSNDMCKEILQKGISTFIKTSNCDPLQENPYILYQQINNKKKKCKIYLSINPIDMLILSKPFSGFSTCVDTNYSHFEGELPHLYDNYDTGFSNPRLSFLSGCFLNKAIIYVPNSFKMPIDNYTDFCIHGYCYRNIIWLDTDRICYSVDYPCDFILKESVPLLRTNIGYHKKIDVPSFSSKIRRTIEDFNIQDKHIMNLFLSARADDIANEEEFTSIFLDRVCVDYTTQRLQYMNFARGSYVNISDGVLNPFTHAVCPNCGNIVDSTQIIKKNKDCIQYMTVCNKCKNKDNLDEEGLN